MKKILLITLLIFLAVSDGCGCGNAGSCPCAAAQGSFDVNQQVIIDTPSTIAPPCATPAIPVPVVSPPQVNIPTITAPQPQVCNLTAPKVVAPPTVTPPTPVIPVIQAPNIPLPQLPPQVPLPTIPIVKPTAPTYAPPSTVGPTPTPLSNIFTFSFQWACRSGVQFISCEANVLWNNVIIASIVPTDYDIHLFKINVTVAGGQNSLQIEGAGISDSYGLTIDNVQLIRFGTATDIVINGDFEVPPQYGGWNIYNNIKGWQGQGIELGWGDIYNLQWNSQVIELDGNSNFEITQYFTFDAAYNLVANAAQYTLFGGKYLTYTLEFDYAARQNGAASPFTSQADILWNDAVIASLVPSDYLLHHFAIQVRVVAGDNTLELDGAGVSDGYGLIIDNVKLTSDYNSTNLIFNGDFSAPALGANNWNYFNGGIAGWWAAKAEAGDGDSIYNANWPAAYGQVIELDSDSNQRYLQTITITQSLFSSLYVYIQNQLGVQTAQNNLNTAAAAFQANLSSAVAIINDAILCQISLYNFEYSHYLSQLYAIQGQSILNLLANQQLLLNQYDYTLDAYGHYYGCSSELDFDDSYFQGLILQNWAGHIVDINGKNIHCHDD